MSEGERVRFRLTAWQRVLPFAPLLFAGCAGLSVKLMEPPPSAAYAGTAVERHHAFEFTVATGVFLALLVLLSLLTNHSFGVTLTPTEVRVHSLRRRVIRWSDVRAVTAENQLGTRSVCLYEEKRRTRLRAPVTGLLLWDRRFEEKYHTIGQWWLDHREG
jgi:hypothetical protein